MSILTAIDETCIMLETTKDERKSWLLGWQVRSGTSYHLLMAGDSQLRDFKDHRSLDEWAHGMCSAGAWKRIPPSCSLTHGPCAECDAPVLDDYYLCRECR